MTKKLEATPEVVKRAMLAILEIMDDLTGDINVVTAEAYARAAIGAVREPTGEMLYAVTRGDDVASWAMDDAWARGIDVALGKGERS